MNSPILHLEEGQSALFGYGSLLSVESVGNSLGHPYQGPFVACHLEGWRRSWNIGMPNQVFYTDTAAGPLYPERILYLNIRPDPACLMNGILFVVSKAELDLFDRRESIYTREKITARLRGVEVTGGDAWVYVGMPEHEVQGAASPARAAVRASYLRILEDGFARLGPEFRAEYERSSDPVPRHLVIEDQRAAGAAR
jgi:hypothetical protein